VSSDVLLHSGICGQLEMERIPSELRLFCPETTQELLTCPLCKVTATRWRLDKKFDWARVLYCHCKKDWVVCACCTKSTVRMINQATIYSHNRNRHAGSTKRKRTTLEPEDGNRVIGDPISVVNERVEEKWMEVRYSPQRQKVS